MNQSDRQGCMKFALEMIHDISNDKKLECEFSLGFGFRVRIRVRLG